MDRSVQKKNPLFLFQPLEVASSAGPPWRLAKPRCRIISNEVLWRKVETQRFIVSKHYLNFWSFVHILSIFTFLNLMKFVATNHSFVLVENLPSIATFALNDHKLTILSSSKHKSNFAVFFFLLKKNGNVSKSTIYFVVVLIN